VADGDDFNGRVIAEFRENGGKVGGYFAGAPLLLLHHYEKNAAPREIPVILLDPVA
jgi:hypothetical protein